ncbi:MAG: sugar ABC transporter substrate-binding protein [Candidatus Binatia bacterium]
MTRSRCAVYSLATVALLALAACRDGGREGIELRFWAFGREGELVRQLIPEFERAHPGVSVRVQQIPWSAAHEKLLTAYVGGGMPDLFQAGSTWIPELVALGAVAPLDARLDASPATHRDFFEGILSASQVAGRTYAVPWYVDTRVLFYRRDLLRTCGWDAPPAGWEEWRRALACVKSRVGPRRYALLLPVTEWQVPVIFAWQHGARLLRGNAEYGNFRAGPFHQSFMFYLSFFRERLAPAEAEGQIANLYQDFAQGFFSAYITGPWNLGEFRTRLPEGLQAAWDTAPMPGLGENEVGISIAGGASLALFSGSPHPEAAWQLIEYLSAPEQQLAFYQLSGDLPARRSAWAAGGLADMPRVRAFRRQLDRVRAPPQIPEWERIAAKISQYAEAAVRGNLEPDGALAALERDVDAILAKRRWLLARSEGAPY